jgi:alkanesulfonate monooxygenase SsuD/methylene tetrahydromethanopterin reductase-like flavin-dependent oxidoreductase (luciferase family)
MRANLLLVAAIAQRTAVLTVGTSLVTLFWSGK